MFVSQIFVDGDSHKSYIVAIIVIDEAHCNNWAKAEGVEGDLLQSEVLKKAIFADFESRHHAAKLNSLEKIKKIALTKEAFTVENGLLTPSLKLMRHAAKKHFKTQIDQMYAEDN